MFYFKFTDGNDIEMYASITVDGMDKATKQQKNEFIEKLKNFCHAKTLEEVNKEEYDAQD